jgi:hypothetical protein
MATPLEFRAPQIDLHFFIGGEVQIAYSSVEILLEPSLITELRYRSSSSHRASSILYRIIV